MEVTFYKEEDGRVLGKRSYEGISKMLIPAFQGHVHDIYLNKEFKSEPDMNSWLIKSVSHTEIGVDITLEGFQNPDSVAEYAEKQRAKINRYIRKNQIVEVDFGHFESLYCLENGLNPNHSRTNSLMPGEMHKRRPCIVLGCRGKSVTVLPLTTKNVKSPKTLSISKGSFKNLHSRYSEQPSYAVLDMIQTVSGHRIFPPRDAKDGKYKHQYSRYKLIDTDTKLLEVSLAEIYNSDVVKQLEDNSNAYKKLSREKFRLLEKNKELLEQLNEKRDSLCEIEKVVCHAAKELGIEGSFENILKELKKL